MTFCLNLRKFLQVCRNLRTFVAVPENLRFTHLGAKKNCESWVPSQKNRISSHDYDLEDLKDRAEGCLLFSLNEENMVKYLIAGDEFHAGKLKGAAKKLVKSKIRVLMVENEWKKIFSGKKDLLIEILADTC